MTAIEVLRDYDKGNDWCACDDSYQDPRCWFCRSRDTILDALKLAAVVGHERCMTSEAHTKYGYLHRIEFGERRGDPDKWSTRWLTTAEAFPALYPDEVTP